MASTLLKIANTNDLIKTSLTPCLLQYFQTGQPTPLLPWVEQETQPLPSVALENPYYHDITVLNTRDLFTPLKLQRKVCRQPFYTSGTGTF
jgi:hypothetical protein